MPRIPGMQSNMDGQDVKCPHIGQDNIRVLKELGYALPEILDLVKGKVISDTNAG